MSGGTRSADSSKIPKPIPNRFPGTMVSQRDEELANMKRIMTQFRVHIAYLQLENDSLSSSFKSMASIDFAEFISRLEKLEDRVCLLFDAAKAQLPTQSKSPDDENTTSICKPTRNQSEKAISQMSTAIRKLPRQLKGRTPEALEFENASTASSIDDSSDFDIQWFNQVKSHANGRADDDDDWVTMNDDNFDSDCDNRSMKTILDSDVDDLADDEVDEGKNVRKRCNTFGYHQKSASEGGYTSEMKIGDVGVSMATSLITDKPMNSAKPSGDGQWLNLDQMTKTRSSTSYKLKAVSQLAGAISWMANLLLRQ